MPCVQGARAVATRFRCEIHDRIHARDGHQLRWCPGWPGCPPVLRRLFRRRPRPLLTREAVRGRWLRRNGGILLSQRELTLEIGNPLRLLLKLFAKSFVLLAQPFDLLRSRMSRVGSPPRDRSCALAPSTRGYEIAINSTTTKSCQVSEGLNCYRRSHSRIVASDRHAATVQSPSVGLAFVTAARLVSNSIAV
jgi:hypothetical protein